MSIRFFVAGLLVLASSGVSAVDGGSGDDASCAHGDGWEEVDVVGLRAIEHREITTDGSSAVYLSTRPLVGPVARGDYVLRIIVGTERRHGRRDGSGHGTMSVGDDEESACDDVVRLFSDENLVDLDITSDVGTGTGYPAGASLRDLFDVSVELSLRNGAVPAGVFDPRNPQTLSQYIGRDPKQPLVVNLRLNGELDRWSTRVFDVVMLTADGNAYGARSGPVILGPELE